MTVRIPFATCEAATVFRVENDTISVSLQYVIGNTEAEHVWPRLGFNGG